MDVPTRHFDLGRVVATRGVLSLLTVAEISHLLDRHVTGDWGDLDAQGMISGAIAPAAATALVAWAGGSFWPAAAFLMLYALISLVSMYLMSRGKYQTEIRETAPAQAGSLS